MDFLQGQKPNRYFIINLILIVAALTPYIKYSIHSGYRYFTISAIIVSVFSGVAFLNYKWGSDNRAKYLLSAFMAFTASFMFFTGDRESGFIWFFFIVPYNHVFTSQRASTTVLASIITIVFVTCSLLSLSINQALSADINTLFIYIIQPAILVAGLWAGGRKNHADLDAREFSFGFPSQYLTPLLADKCKLNDIHLLDFLNSLEEGIFIANREGTIINSSSKFASFFDTRSEDLSGFSIFDKYALPHTYQIKAFNLIRKNMDGLPSGPDEFVFELKNGKKIRLLIMTMPIIIESTPSVIGIAKPLQRQKGTFPQEAGPKDKFQTLSENSTDIIIRFDRQLRHVYANYAITGLTGMAVENFLGKTCQETKYPRPILDTLEEKVSKVFENGEPVETEFYHDWGTGEVYFDLRLIPEKSPSGRVETVLSTARDITPLKKAHMTIQALTQELIRAQELERNRIALDLHDNVAQNLASLKIACDTIFDQEPGVSAQTVQRFRHFSALLKCGIGSVRELAYNLRPPGIDQLGIIKTLSQLCSEFTAAYRIKTDFQSWGIEGLKLSSDTQINLYRLMQEALSNVKKHSGAQNVNIKLVSSHPNLILRVEDDGTGFNVDLRSREAVNEKRMGLQGMHERARMLGGRMKIISRSGEGTKVIIEIPVSVAPDRNGSEDYAILEKMSL